MRIYIEPIMTAISWFPLVAFLITLPYMVVQYRRYGAILMLRTVIVYSFILYLMCAYFLTILPLPPIEEVAKLQTPYLQLTPFADVACWLRESGAVLTQPATWTKLLNRDLFVMLANIVMLIPLGIYLRYYFHCSWKATLFISLGASLVFELTQLSALFGIYPRPYRLCETDDLITNALGGMIGYWLAKPLMRVLPTKEHLDAVAYHRGQHVSVTRRITAAIVDWIIVGFLLLVLMIVTPLFHWLLDDSSLLMLLKLGAVYVGCVFAYFIVGEWLQHGLTIGKRLTHLQLIDERTQGRPHFWQCLVRYSLLYYAFVPLPVIAMFLFMYGAPNDRISKGLLLTICLFLLLLYAIVVVMIVIRVLTRSNQLPHGELSKTRNISTLIVTTDMLDHVGDKPTDDPKLNDVPLDEMAVGKDAMLNG